MSKFVLPDPMPEPPDILDKVMTYEDFLDVLTDAWLVAENVEGGEVNSRFRVGLFYLLDQKAAERFSRQELERGK